MLGYVRLLFVRNITKIYGLKSPNFIPQLHIPPKIIFWLRIFLFASHLNIRASSLKPMSIRSFLVTYNLFWSTFVNPPSPRLMIWGMNFSG